MLLRTKSKMQHHNSRHSESMANDQTIGAGMITLQLFSGQIHVEETLTIAAGWVLPPLKVLKGVYN